MERLASAPQLPGRGSPTAPSNHPATTPAAPQPVPGAATTRNPLLCSRAPHRSFLSNGHPCATGDPRVRFGPNVVLHPRRTPLPDWAVVGSCGAGASWAAQRYSLAPGGPFPHQRALPPPAYFYPAYRLQHSDAGMPSTPAADERLLTASAHSSTRHWCSQDELDRGNWLRVSERSLTFPGLFVVFKTDI